MPLQDRKLENNIAFADPIIYQSSDSNSTLPALGFATNVGTLAQITLLSVFASDIFKRMSDELTVVGDRVALAKRRCTLINAALLGETDTTNLEKTLSKEAISDDSFLVNSGSGVMLPSVLTQSEVQCLSSDIDSVFFLSDPDQHYDVLQKLLLQPETVPAHARRRYEMINAPPPLSEILDDGQVSQRKFSDPSLFFQKWQREQEQKMLAAREEKERRRAERRGRQELLKGVGGAHKSRKLKKPKAVVWKDRFQFFDSNPLSPQSAPAALYPAYAPTRPSVGIDEPDSNSSSSAHRDSVRRVSFHIPDAYSSTVVGGGGLSRSSSARQLVRVSGLSTGTSQMLLLRLTPTVEVTSSSTNRSHLDNESMRERESIISSKGDGSASIFLPTALLPQVENSGGEEEEDEEDDDDDDDAVIVDEGEDDFTAEDENFIPAEDSDDENVAIVDEAVDDDDEGKEELHTQKQDDNKDSRHSRRAPVRTMRSSAPSLRLTFPPEEIEVQRMIAHASSRYRGVSADGPRAVPMTRSGSKDTDYPPMLTEESKHTDAPTDVYSDREPSLYPYESKAAIGNVNGTSNSKAHEDEEGTGRVSIMVRKLQKAHRDSQSRYLPAPAHSPTFSKSLRFTPTADRAQIISAQYDRFRVAAAALAPSPTAPSSLIGTFSSTPTPGPPVVSPGSSAPLLRTYSAQGLRDVDARISNRALLLPDAGPSGTGRQASTTTRPKLLGLMMQQEYGRQSGAPNGARNSTMSPFVSSSDPSATPERPQGTLRGPGGLVLDLSAPKLKSAASLSNSSSHPAAVAPRKPATLLDQLSAGKSVLRKTATSGEETGAKVPSPNLGGIGESAVSKILARRQYLRAEADSDESESESDEDW